MKYLPFILLFLVILGCGNAPRPETSPPIPSTPVPSTKQPTEADMLGLRKLYIKETENKLLDQGYDCYLSLLGKKQNELQIKFILMSRPVVHKMSKDPDFISTISKIGFTKVHFTDGFNDSWTLPIAQQPTISNKVRTLPKN